MTILKMARRLNASLRLTLALIAFPPLLAFILLAGYEAYSKYDSYVRLERQLRLETLAQSGGALALILPAEAMSTPDQRLARQRATDEALSNLLAAFENWKKEGNSDQFVEETIAFIAGKRADILNYRRVLDAGQDATPIRLSSFQPAVAAGIRLVSRAGYVVDDLDLARKLDGFFSLLQLNDANLMERNTGASFLRSGQLSPAELVTLTKSRELRAEYTPRMRALLPASLVRDFDAFSLAVEPTLEKLRPAVRSGDQNAVSATNLQEWQRAVDQRERAMANLIGNAGHLLKTEGKAKMDALRQSVWWVTAGLLAVSGLVFALCFYVVRKLANQMRSLAHRMKTLAGGDTSSDIPFMDRTDEIGTMATAMGAFRENIIENRRLGSEQEAAKAAEAERQRAVRHELADRFENAIGGIVDIVSAAANDMQATATQLAAAAREASAQSTSVASAAEEAGSSVTAVAGSAEELGASVQEISRQVGHSASLARSAVGEANATSTIVAELSQGASRIGDIVEMISTIAAQTNLLALNATIEAARAGEAGRGFAVVAQEVKGLAEQTAKATSEIGTQIVSIQETTNKAVQAIAGITTSIGSIDQVTSSIASAVEQQSAATREIVASVGQASSGTNEVSSAISSVAQAAEETGQGANQVLSASADLARQAERLSAELRQFLEMVRAA